MIDVRVLILNNVTNPEVEIPKEKPYIYDFSLRGINKKITQNTILKGP